MTKLLSLLGTLSRRSALLISGFLLGFMVAQSDSEIRYQLEDLIKSSGLTPELLAIAFPLISEWFSQQHNKALQGF